MLDVTNVASARQFRSIQRREPGTPGQALAAPLYIRKGTILVGAPYVDVPGEERDPSISPGGKVYAFLLYRGSWFESQRLNDDGRLFMQLGSNVAVSRSLAAAVAPFDVPASWSNCTVIAFDRVGAELTSGRSVTHGGNDGVTVSDVDASERRIVAGSQESANFGGPERGSVRIVELDAPDAAAH